MRDKRVLLLGTTGTLGSHLAGALSSQFHVLAPRSRNARVVPMASGVSWLSTSIDAARQIGLDRIIAESRPDAIVNCIAVTAGSGCADDHVACVSVNSLFPHRLAEASRNYGCHLIHISTDGVFSGKGGNYSESDLPDPQDLYGRSKLAGEVIDKDCLTLRTSFFGPSPTGRGLVEWLIAHRGARIQGYTDYIFTGLSTTAVSRAIIAVLARATRLSGLYHLGGSAMSKYDLLVMLSRKLQLGITIDPVAVGAVDRSLNSARFWAAIESAPPLLEQMVEDVQLELDAAHRCGTYRGAC